MTRFGNPGKLAVLAAGAMLAFGSTAANALLVDGFGDDQGPVTAEGLSGGASIPSIADTISLTDTELTNATRTLSTLLLQSNSALAQVSMFVDSSILSYAQTPNTQGNGTVSYAFDPVSMTGLDLVITVLFSDRGGSLDVTLSDVSNSSTQTIVLPEVFTSQDFVLSLASFGGVNLAAVTGLDVLIEGQFTSALDLQIDLVEAVPTPLPLGLIGIGLGAMSFVSWRRGAKNRQLAVR